MTVTTSAGSNAENGILEKTEVQMAESIMQSRRECYVCRMLYGVVTVKELEEHHVLNGPLRPLSERYGLKVWLCHKHHNEPGYSAHFDHRLRLYLKQQAQRNFEDRYSHRQWMAEIGKDYLKYAEHSSDYGASRR